MEKCVLGALDPCESVYLGGEAPKKVTQCYDYPVPE